MQTAINAILPSVTGFLVPMNRAPIMTNVQCTLGNTLTENTSATFRISGATDSEGDAIHYKIINDSNAVISFSKTVSLAIIFFHLISLSNRLIHLSSMVFLN